MAERGLTNSVLIRPTHMVLKSLAEVASAGWKALKPIVLTSPCAAPRELSDCKMMGGKYARIWAAVSDD